MKKSSSLYIFSILALIITSWRILFIYFSPYNLAPDEAQYWAWSKDLAFGYYSKPPMIAWLIHLFTSFCGDSEFCIRLPSPILHMLIAFTIFAIANELFNARTAFYSALTYLTLPGVTLSSSLMSTDALLLFFWALALLSFIHAERDNKTINWLLAGLFAGFGMLSKYTMLAFLASVLFYIFTSKKTFKSRGIYVAVATAFLVFIPNIIWNFNNNFVSLIHTGDNLNPEGESFNLDKFFEFFISQFAVFGPIMFASLLYIFARKMKTLENSNSTRLLISFIIPLLFIAFTVALLKRAHGNWAAAAYVAASIFIVWWLLERNYEKLIKISISLHIIAMLIFFNFGAIADFMHIKKTPFDKLIGWQELGYKAKELAKKNNAGIFSDERENVAALKYYARDGERPAEIFKWNEDGLIQDHFDMTADIKTEEGRDFIFISKADDIAKVENNFASTKKLAEIIVNHKPYNLYLMKNFKGY